MSKNKTIVKVNGGGIGFCGALAILFIGLRLAGVVDWHWAWVLAPLWVPAAICLALAVLCLVVYFALVALGAAVSAAVPPKDAMPPLPSRRTE